MSIFATPKLGKVSKRSNTLVCKRCKHLCYQQGYVLDIYKIYKCSNCTSKWAMSSGDQVTRYTDY